jgi:hypothetical protein
MGFEWLIVIVIRLLVPLTILRWPLFGGILAIIADNLDVVILDFLHTPDFGPYNVVDKYLDIYYLALEVFVSLRWKNSWAKKTSIFLFIYRLVGTLAYELTGIRALLFIFPNLFENFFIFYVIYTKVVKKDRLTNWKSLFIVNFILLMPKEFQEYMLHVSQYPIYGWIRENIFSLFKF